MYFNRYKYFQGKVSQDKGVQRRQGFGAGVFG